MRKASIFTLIALTFFLFACTAGKTEAMPNTPGGGTNMTSMNDMERPRDEGGTINPSFYISHAEHLATPVWKAYIDGQPYTMTFSNLSRKWINVNIYKGPAIDRTQIIFEGDTQMEEFSTFGHVVQIVPEEKDKEFLPGYRYMLVSRDGYGIVHISMRQDAYNAFIPDNPFGKLGKIFTGTPTKSDSIAWEFVNEPNPDELQYLTLTRSQPAGTGIEYSAAVEPEGYLQKTIDTVNYRGPDMPGRSGEHKWRWKALKDGIVKITISGGYGPMNNNNADISYYEIKNGIIHNITKEMQNSMVNMPSQPKQDMADSTWTCSNCGAANDRNFCTECGNPRSAEQ